MRFCRKASITISLGYEVTNYRSFQNPLKYVDIGLCSLLWSLEKVWRCHYQSRQTYQKLS